MRKNEAEKDFRLLTFLNGSKKFSNRWKSKSIFDYKIIQNILDKTSKKGTGNNGYPDLIYINEKNKLLILLENKDSTKDHTSKMEEKYNPIKYSVDGVVHYLSFFVDEKLENEEESVKKYLKDWKILGIAFSGDIESEYDHKIDTFVVKNSQVENLNIKEFFDEEDYLALFENINLEKITNDISKSSSEINQLLRNLDSQNRPVLLSALMICLFSDSDFKKTYVNWEIKNIIRNIPSTLNDILLNQGIDQSKIKVLLNKISFIDTDVDLNNTTVLKDILVELDNKVIPLFKTKSSYDIIGKFYEEFLKYAGITNVKKGIVLTPNHIAKLFTDLIDFKTDDIILDPACGTGAFLIAGMNKLISKIESSDLPNKEMRKNLVKQNQLVGFEKNDTMYSLAISNMLFRGDGKSQIFNDDFFSNNADELLKKIKPTIGFVNPPYSGLDNAKNPTKKEIQFLERMLDNCSRYGIIIAPMSTYFKDEDIRNRILEKHTLKYVINMPKELFQPNASTHTAIAVFETHLPHNKKEVVFYDLKEDGLVLSKNKGRTDVLNKWNTVKKDLLTKLHSPDKYNDFINLVYKKIEKDEEWIIQAHSKSDFTLLTDKDFEKTIKEYTIFSTKLKFDLIGKDIDELTLLEILNKNTISAEQELESI